MSLLNIGEKVGDHKVLEFVGEGSYGEVYIVDGRYNKQALKILKKCLNEEEKNKLLDEPYVLKGITHKNIIRVFESGVHKIGECYHHYFIMEYHSNGSLAKYQETFIAKKKFLDFERSLDIIKQVCEGIKACNYCPEFIAHKDIKPENILIKVEPSDTTMILSDFGLAKTTTNFYYDDGKIDGTLNYIPPDDNLNTPKRDVYAIGVLFYYLLTNEFPYDVEDKSQINTREPWDKKPIAPSEINKDSYKGIDKIILKAIDKDYENRYKDAAELLKDIKNWKNRNLNPWPGEDQTSAIFTGVGIVLGIIIGYLSNFLILIALIPLIACHYSKYSKIMPSISLVTLLIVGVIFAIFGLEPIAYNQIILAIIPLLVLYSYTISEKLYKIM